MCRAFVLVHVVLAAAAVLSFGSASSATAHEIRFGARVLDMESATVAHVAYANDVPFIAARSLSDLAGGGEGENQMAVFRDLAAGNAAAVVKAFLRSLPAEG